MLYFFQMSTQTNEDNLDIEIQTDEINTCNKWTQFPITCRKHLSTNEDIKMFKKVSNVVCKKKNVSP